MERLLKKKYFIKNHLVGYLIVGIWVLGNIAAFAHTYYTFATGLQFFYLRQIIGQGLCFAKSAAMCININTMLIFLPICRNLITILRSLKFIPTAIKRGLFDDEIEYHIYIAFAIIFFSAVHTVAHIYNVTMFIVTYIQTATSKTTLAQNLSTIPSVGVPVNPLRFAKPNYLVLESLRLVAAYTGVLLWIALLFILATAVKRARKARFNLFWYTHIIMMIVYVSSFCFHGIQGVVTSQSNVMAHNPKNCYKDFDSWGSDANCPMPVFKNTPPASWKWVLGTLIMYVIERIARFFRFLYSHKILKAVIHPSRVIELQIENNRTKKGYIKYRAGQYVFLNYNPLSFFEWHPFTITSAPDDPYLSVHIRCGGDWTGSLYEKLKNPDAINNPELNNISIDAPYGSCAEDVFLYSRIVLIGAGIGVTPYASILKHILNEHKSKTDVKVKKVHFLWICTNVEAFEWFGNMLKDLENELIKSDKSDLVEIKIFFTAKDFNIGQIRDVWRRFGEDVDSFTGLQQKTNFGRPDFDLYFRNLCSTIANETEGKQKVGVFFCGPYELSTTVYKACNNHSTETVRFYISKENF